jgi:hypothetical protein
MQTEILFLIDPRVSFILVYDMLKVGYLLSLREHYFCVERSLIFSHIPPFADVMKDFGSSSKGCFVFSHKLNSKFDRRTARPIFVCSNPKRIPVTDSTKWYETLCKNNTHTNNYI